MNRVHSFLFILAAAPVAALTADVSAVVDSVAGNAIAQKNAAEQSFIKSIDAKHYPDRLAIELIVKQQGIKTVEMMRQVISLPQVADNSKRFSLPNLQASLNIYSKSKNYPIPEDLQTLSKNAALALENIIGIEEAKATRLAQNPHATEDVSKQREEEKQLLALKSRYDTYLKQAESVRMNKYGIDTQKLNVDIVPIINNAVKSVSSISTPQNREQLLNALLDALVEGW